MKIKAEQKNSRQSPRKVRLLANQVKDLSLEGAFTQLALMERKGSIVLLKVMRQAVANAVHNHQLSIDQLEIDKILVKTGPTYKRWQPVSRGRAHSILKRTCHVEVVLKTKDETDQQSEESAKKSKKVASNKKKKTKAEVTAESKKQTQKSKPSAASKSEKETKKSSKSSKSTKSKEKEATKSNKKTENKSKTKSK